VVTKPLHERAAEALGLPSTWLDDARAAPPKPPTADCLEPDEIASLELLAPGRRAHLATCAFCNAVVAATGR